MVSRVLPGQQSYQRKEKVIKLVLSNPQMKIQHRNKKIRSVFLQELGSINVVQSLVNSSNISIFESLHFICNFSVPKSILKEEAISKNCYFYCPINQNSSGVFV